jgi:hypothetical protein
MKMLWFLSLGLIRMGTVPAPREKDFVLGTWIASTVQPGWSEIVMWCRPGSTASTWASTMFQGWTRYDHLTLVAPSGSVQVSLSPLRSGSRRENHRYASTQHLVSTLSKLSREHAGRLEGENAPWEK